MAICCISGCTREARAKGLCASHYDRMRNGLDLSVPFRQVIRSGSDADRLKAKTRVNPQTGCWEWTASVTPLGYGQFRFQGTRELAHRVSWMLFRGAIPANSTAYGTQNVLHRCDNPRCVNPEHLFLGDQADNANDSVSKNRWGKRGLIGEMHGRAELTEQQVREIRASTEAAAVLAARYHVSKSTIQHIRKRRSWTYLQE